MLERTIKSGDVLEVEGQFVRVERLGFRTTFARTLDDEEIIVPNATIVQSTVKNYTLKDSVYRLRSQVGVAYDSDMALAKRVLDEAARSTTVRLVEREPLAILREFGDSSVIWEVSIWVDDPWRSRRMKGDLLEAIWVAFKKHGITFAYPQMDVHFDRGIPCDPKSTPPAS